MKNKIKTGATILIAGLLVCSAAYALTNIVMAEQSSDPMSGSEVGLWAGNTAGANEAWWRRDDGSSVDLSATGGGASDEVGAKVFDTSAQTIATGATGVLTFDSEVWDPNGYHDTVTNNTRITPTVAGKYIVVANVSWALNGTGSRYVAVRLNGTTIQNSSTRAAVSGSLVHGLTVSSIVDLNGSTDYVEAVGAQTSGGNLNTAASGQVQGKSLSAQRIAD